LPYRDSHDGIPVLRLPLWVGRHSTSARILQGLTFTASLLAATPSISRPEAVIAASPSFPALLPAMLFCRARKVPFVPWLHDILPEGAMVTGHVDEIGFVSPPSRWLERAADEAATRIVVLSRPFASNLISKGV